MAVKKDRRKGIQFALFAGAFAEQEKQENGINQNQGNDKSRRGEEMIREFYLMDCMDLMKRYSDKHFDLAIVDPIYGDLVTRGGYSKGGGWNKAKPKNYNCKVWTQSKTEKKYFNELFRVSKSQIIFGGNYFIEEINKNSSCWLIWDKNNTAHYADAELMWTSFATAVRIFKYTWNGMIQEDMKNKENRIHTMQKPISLYKWLLKNYAKEGDLILDTHVGSASSLIACEEMGFSYIGCELDPDYFRMAKERIEKFREQLRMF